MPTVLECLGSQPPDVRGVTQIPIQGVSMSSSFAARRRRRRGRRSSTRCWAPAGSGTTAGRPSPRTRRSAAGATTTQDTWELYHVDTDRSELHDLAAEQPDRLAELIGLWFYEAGANHAFPLDDRSALEIILTPRPQLIAPRDRYVYRPGGAEIPELARSTSATAPSPSAPRWTCPTPGAQGVLFAHGSRFGGHALYVKDNRLHYVNNFVGVNEQRVDATEDLPTGEHLILSASFDKTGEDPPGAATAPVALPRRPQGRRGPDPDPTGLLLPRRRGPRRRPRQRRRGHRRLPGQTPHRFTGGTLHRVAVDVSGEPYVDLEREAVAMLARE